MRNSLYVSMGCVMLALVTLAAGCDGDSESGAQVECRLASDCGGGQRVRGRPLRGAGVRGRVLCVLEKPFEKYMPCFLVSSRPSCISVEPAMQGLLRAITVRSSGAC